VPAPRAVQDRADDLASLLGCVDVLRSDPLHGEDVPNRMRSSSRRRAAGTGDVEVEEHLPRRGLDSGRVDRLRSDKRPFGVAAVRVDADLPEPGFGLLEGGIGVAGRVDCRTLPFGGEPGVGRAADCAEDRRRDSGRIAQQTQ
jgi:hypothetical protein